MHVLSWLQATHGKMAFISTSNTSSMSSARVVSNIAQACNAMFHGGTAPGLQLDVFVAV